MGRWLACKVPETLDLPASKGLIPGIVASDEFGRKKGDRDLPLVWQWNHNPDNRFWSVAQRKDYLRLTTGRIDLTLLSARNTLTQRTIGPVCSGTTCMEIAGMKDGDFAGLCLLQSNYGLVGVKMTDGSKYIYMINAGSEESVEQASIPVSAKKVYFKAECDFRKLADVAYFYYSLDGKKWNAIGEPLKMKYTLTHFMGYRFGLFNYATKETGGYVDFDYFRINDKLTQFNAQNNSPYLFGDFEAATVYFNNGRQSDEKVNYHLPSNKIRFIDKKDKVIKEVSDTQMLDSIVVGKRVFIPDSVHEGWFEILSEKPVVQVQYFAKTKPKGKQVGFGGTSELTRTSTYQYLDGGALILKEPEMEVVGYYNYYWIFKDGKRKQFKSLAQFVKLYPKQKAQLNQYIQDNHINFEDVEAIVKLCLYAESL